MMDLLVTCVMLALTSANVISTPASLLVLYGNGKSEIIIKEINTREMIKTFTIQIEKPTGIAMVYDKDLIFFADRERVYRIHLVDEVGNRKISGKGELFTNETADHFEMVFYNVDSSVSIRNLLIDVSSKMLYVMGTIKAYDDTYFLKIDPEDGNVVLDNHFYGVTSTHFALRNGMLYCRCSSAVICNISMHALDGGKPWQQLITLNSLSQFTVDKLTNRLFYTQGRNVIRVLDGNLTTTSNSSLERRVVIADSYVTKNIKEIVVYGKIVIWSSSAWKRLYIGDLNNNNNFMSKRNVHVLDESSHDTNYEFDNIIIFEDAFET